MRWINRADDLYKTIVRMDAPEEIQNLAWEARQGFIEAQDLRRCYYGQKYVRPGSARLLNQASREHRKGVKAHRAAHAWLSAYFTNLASPNAEENYSQA